MKFGDHAHGTITRFDDDGRGVFDVGLGDGASKRPFSVPYATIGDEVEAKCIKRMKGRFVGDLVRVIAPGPSRVEGSAALPYAPWMHIRYEDQLAFKRDLINRSLENAGHAERIAEVIPCPIDPARRTDAAGPLFYRNRMDFVFGWKGELGMKQLGAWNRYVDLEDCLLMEGSAEILKVFHDFLLAFPELWPWDAKKHEGDLRYVLVRQGKNTGERIVALIVKDLSRITDSMREWLVAKLDAHAASVCLSENPLITDLSIGTTIVPLKGKETFDEIINGTRYTIHLNSFFQTNSSMAAILQNTVWELMSGTSRLRDFTTPRLLDLYCGLGFFGIDFARRDPNLRVDGFEIDEHAIKLARVNAKQNGVERRCEFASGKAEDLSWKTTDADACIIDPPRAGLHPNVIEALIDRKFPRLVYVSCKYQRLVEELKRLKTAYAIEEIRALDLFPQTPHVEVVVGMRAKST